jgi:hypothetical protein
MKACCSRFSTLETPALETCSVACLCHALHAPQQLQDLTSYIISAQTTKAIAS